MRIAEHERDGLLPVQAGRTSEAGSPRVDALDRALGGLTPPGALPPPWQHAATTFALDAFELDVLLLALAPSVDPSFLGLFGRLKGLLGRAPLDVECALTILTEGLEERVARRAAFGPRGHLREHHLLQLRPGLESSDPLLGLEIGMSASMISALLGVDALDPALAGFSSLEWPTERLEDVVLPEAIRARLEALVLHHDDVVGALASWGLDTAPSGGPGATVLLAGPPGTGKTLTARALAGSLGRPLLRVDTGRLDTSDLGLDNALDRVIRDARLQSALLLFDDCEGLFTPSRRATGRLAGLLAALERFEGVSLLTTNVPGALDPAVERRVLGRITLELPTPRLRREIWALHLPEGAPTETLDLETLSRRFELSGGAIRNAILVAAHQAAARAARDGATVESAVISQTDLENCAHEQLRHRLHETADRERSTRRVDDLILPADTLSQVSEILDAATARATVFREWGFGRKFTKGRAISALFDGEPGTGKTLAAEVIASELSLALYRVNVAEVVSKYVGETEKNLTRVFAEARVSSAVLLFDEADALFAKRVDVQAAQDRFVNMEVNTLLQLIERYEGLVILTTNLKTALDSAFERRLSYKIEFPFPEADLRERIWRHLLPPEAPVADDVDVKRLGASYDLSGGSIKNAVLRAAYASAAAGESLTMKRLEDAARRECQAAGKLVRVTREEDW